MPLQIKNWDDLYEVAQSRKCTTMHWVAIPNTHNGTGYALMTKHEKATDLFSAWLLIVQVASTLPKRGLLVTDSGKEVTIENMAYRTHFPVGIFELGFVFFVKIGWLERV